MPFLFLQDKFSDFLFAFLLTKSLQEKTYSIRKEFDIQEQILYFKGRFMSSRGDKTFLSELPPPKSVYLPFYKNMDSVPLMKLQGTGTASNSFFKDISRLYRLFALL